MIPTLVPHGRAGQGLHPLVSPLVSMLLPLLVLLMGAQAVADEVDIVFSDRLRPHVETVSALQQSLRAEDVRLFRTVENGDTSEELRAIEQAVARQPDLIVLLGDDALRAALSMRVHVPMLSLMAVRLHRGMEGDPPLTGVDLRPDPAEVAAELRRLVHADASVFTYFSPGLSGFYVREAAAVFHADGLQLVARPWPGHDVVAALNREMGKYDIYWMQLEEKSVRPDVLRLLFSVATRQGKGLIGLSEKYVRTGAMIAWTPEPEQVGFQGAALANRILRGEAPQSIPIEHAHRMRVNINRRFASGEQEQIAGLQGQSR